MEFDPSQILGQNDGQYAANSSLIILNQPIENVHRLKTLWKNTSYRICADGGADRLHESLTPSMQPYVDWLPDLIHGDLDSFGHIARGAREYYESKGVQISEDDDQYRTDFGKCMLVLIKGYKSTNRPDLDVLGPDRPLHVPQTIAIMSGMGGRLDQAIGLLHEMLRETLAHPQNSEKPISLYFVSEQSVSFILPIGRNVIRGINPHNGIFEKHAGILPIYGPARITIKGFEWDVENWETKMGGNVSTSNHVLGDEVVVEVFEQNVLFTIELVHQCS